MTARAPCGANKIYIVLGKTKQFLPRIISSYEEISPQRTRKNFLSSHKFAQLYETGVDGATAYKKMADSRKSHRRYAGTCPWEEKEEKRGHYSRNRQISL